MTRFAAWALAWAAIATAGATAPDALAAARSRALAADTTRVALPDPVLAPDLPRALAALDSARAAAAADRHAEAIRLYRRAIKLYPPLGDDLGVEVGNQYTWADEPDSAIAWYRWHLARHPDDADAKIGVARLTSWRDDLDGAERWYDEVLAADSTNLDARLGKAQVVNWAGKHRQATTLYRGILSDHPDEDEARAGLVQALRWMGRPDSAVALADSLGTPMTDAIAADIRRASAPGVSYTFEHNEDSDDIQRRYHTVRGAFSPTLLTRTGVDYVHATFEQPGRPEVTRDGLAAAVDWRYSAAFALHANLGYQWNSFDPSSLGPRTEFDLFVYDVYATLTPRDWRRIDLGLARGPIDNPDAIFRGISRTEASAGLDQRLRANLEWVISLEAGWYTDGNSSIAVGTRAVWEPLWRLPGNWSHRFASSTGFAYFGFKETNDNGYYDPRQYVSFYEELALNMVFSPLLRARLAGRVSVDQENTDGWFPTGRFEASGSWTIWRGLALTAGYTNANSRLDDRPGYEIDGYYVTLEWMFW